MNLNSKRIKNKFIKINFTTILFVLMTLISGTFAWYAFSNVVNVDETQLAINTWNITTTNNDVEVNDLDIVIDDIYPGFDGYDKTIIIGNDGDFNALVSYKITYLRILDNEIDVTNQQNVIDLLAQNYPFTINFYLQDSFLEAGFDSLFMYSVFWPINQGNDILDTQWGNDIMDFKNSEEEEFQNNPSYIIRKPIELKIELEAKWDEENIGYSEEDFIGYEYYLDENGMECSDYSSDTCEWYDYIGNGKYIDYDLTSSISSINASQISNQSYNTLSFNDVLNVIKKDIIDTNIVIENLSNRVLGNSSVSTFPSIKNKLILNNGYVTFKYDMFQIFIGLEQGTCYWVNESYDSTHTFAIKNIDNNKVKLYPELNTNSCGYIVVGSFNN